jgi:hypothetical protein
MHAESTTRDAQAAAEKLGKKLLVVRAGTEREDVGKSMRQHSRSEEPSLVS